MKKYLSYLALFTTVLITAPCGAESGLISQHDNVAVVRVPEWQPDTNLPFELSDGATCYIPANEKDVYDLIVKMLTSGMVANMQCHEDPENFNQKSD